MKLGMPHNQRVTVETKVMEMGGPTQELGKNRLHAGIVILQTTNILHARIELCLAIMECSVNVVGVFMHLTLYVTRSL